MIYNLKKISKNYCKPIKFESKKILDSIENLLANYPEIIQSYIYGDKKNYLVALIVVSKELEDRKSKIKVIIDKVNQELSIIEKIKKFIIIDDPFTIENQMLTPTMKIRRHQIKKVFGEQIEKLYF